MSTPIPTNRARFSLEELLVATGGKLLYRGVSVPGCVGVSTDSRTVAPDNLFVALQGARFDGHAHVAEAIQKGASTLVVSKPVQAPADVTVVGVKDTLGALGLLARAHRKRWAARPHETSRRVIAVAGSAGKTTLCRAVSALLNHLGSRVHRPVGNLNNAIGIPMVLFGLGDEYDTCVVEIGTSRPGEVAYGASLAEPDLGILTLISVEHSESLGDLDAIAIEEGALLASLPPEGVAIVNGDDAYCAAQLLRSRARTWVRYGTRTDADVRIVKRKAKGILGSDLKLSVYGNVSSSTHEGLSSASLRVSTPLLGMAGAYATCAAVAAARALHPGGLSSSRISSGFALLAHEFGVAEEAGRLAPRTLADGTIVLDDTYNANRASMIAGIEAAREIAHQLSRRLLLVLGEMRELGTLSAQEHNEVGRVAAVVHPDLLIAVGGDAKRFAQVVEHSGGSATFVPDKDGAIELLGMCLQPGDVVLVKGSRGVGLEAVVAAILGAQGKERDLRALFPIPECCRVARLFERSALHPVSDHCCDDHRNAL